MLKMSECVNDYVDDDDVDVDVDPNEDESIGIFYHL